jgi:SAM-dependent methyltransferase
MTELDPSSVQKREAWAAKAGTETYIQEMGPYALRRDEQIVRGLLGKGPGKLLDLPCGTGRFLALEKELGFTVTAADYSPTMLRIAQRHAGVEFIRVDAFAPPFEPQTFDIILISRLLFHYRNPEAILKALAPALKQGGRMIFDTLNRLSLRWWASVLLSPWRRDPARRLYFETYRSMRRKLQPLGLKVVCRRSAYVLPTRAYRFLPRFVVAMIHAIEGIVPPPLRVLSFWAVMRE